MTRLTLTEIIQRRFSFMKEGKLECDRCLNVFLLPDENQIMRRLCDKCHQSDIDRRKEAESAEVGRTSSPESFEMRIDVHGSGPIATPEYRGAGSSIAGRSDARWYKKAGGSGDG